MPLSYNAQMKITIAKYYIPSGRCVQALDYSHKDVEGNAIKAPDSVLKPFKTKSGRIVFEGRGIDPDIAMTLPDFKNISLALATKNLFFDFAVTYYRQHPQILPASQFAITDDVYNEFMSFLQGKDLSLIHI